MDIKKKHHFVSQFYLREWGNDNGEIWVFDGIKTYRPSIDSSIGFQKHLYRLTLFSAEQRNLIRNYCISVGYEKLSTYRLTILSILDTQEVFEKGNKIQEITGIKSKYLNDLQNYFNSNLFEDSFSESENKFKITLKKIINKEFKSLNLNDYDILVHFIAFQLAKTPKKLNNMKINTTEEIVKYFNFSDDQLHNFNLLMALCIAEQIYLSSLSRLDIINIYYNNTNINFITSDDPSFNQKLLEKELFIQIPISPKVMIEISKNMILEKNRNELLKYFIFHKKNANYVSVFDKVIFHKDINTEHEALKINQKIFNNRDRAVYGLKEDDFINLI